MYSQAAVYVLYSILLGVALFAYLPFYAVRMKISRKGRVFLKERLGFGPPVPNADGDSLWIHAVSVGEVLSLQNLVKDLKAGHPEWDIYFSSLTDAGIRQATDKLGSSARVFVVPLDFAGCIRRILRAIKPGILVLAESEFWPNLLREASRATRGIIVVNGRISERSFRRFRRFRPLAKKLLGRVDVFLVQTADDKERLENLGMDPGRIRVSGNLKCETRLPSFTAEDLGRMKGALGVVAGSMVVVAGSTHKGEEEQLLEAFS
ncbi:MAG TPA: glycosyltransferase N-terminal domain-containing protein, partial [Candidatus Aminicenantes bacterium]|nr:glycosyltransferase N-terminal domain-containing protein [Candidatus Aminicenantes bacterium]